MRNQTILFSVIFCLLFSVVQISNGLPSKTKIFKDAKGKTPYDYVNPFIGTKGYGHTFPGAVAPFGMVQVSPDTETRTPDKSYPWCAGYQYNDTSIMGFSHTHFSGTGHSDLGDILIMPTVGEVQMVPGTLENPDLGYRSRFSHEGERAEPGFYSVRLQDYDILAELTATTRVAFHRYTFPDNQQANIIIDLKHAIYNFDNKVVWAYIRVVNDRLLMGYRQTTGWAKNRKIFFAIAFSKPFDSFGYVREDKEHYYFRTKDKYVSYKGKVGSKEMFANKLKTIFSFNTKKCESLLIKVALSGVDLAGALKNLKSEIPHWDFEKTKRETKELWNEELNEIIIEGSQAEKEIFYTAMYHTLLAPMTYGDVDDRYRGCDQQIHRADHFTPYTTFSLWDTYRAAHPLYTIIKKERVNDMIKSMVAHFQQSPDGILPIWPFHGNETWCMIGYHSVSVIADAYLKGIRDYDVQETYRAIKATATHRDYDGLGYYMDLGYVPIDKEEEAASKTLEYAYDDYVIALMAKAMGNEEDYEAFSKRALNYINIYDKKTHFMRAKKADGKWSTPFDPFLANYGGDYTEGNAWQYTWYVPHDVQGLITLMGGKKNFIRRLDKLFVLETEKKKYAEVDDISGLIGQYAHGNEPSQHIAYLYNYAGAPHRTQERINQIMKGLFNNTPDGICGNEDCGQMSAWYIFSSMGFYPVCPGDGTYEIGKPCLKKATIYLEKERTFVIEAKNLSKNNIYIQSAFLNGKAWNKSFIYHKDMMKGGSLLFKMGPKPNKKWATSNGSLPPSLSRNRSK